MIANLNFALKGTILMKIAILSDIHGNYIALQKCLDHALSQKVDSCIFLGDYLGEFPYPQKTLEILYEMRSKYSCFFLRGNKEDYWVNRRKDVNCEWKNGNHSIMAMITNYENLYTTDIDFFQSLPISRKIELEGFEPILVCHGTPYVNNRTLLPYDERIQEIISECEEKYIICGHTHIQGLVYDGEKKVINAGAVGVPLKCPQKTQYTILVSEGREWNYNFISLEYDVKKVVHEIHESGLWDKSPYWCKITEHLLYTGEISHGTVLNHVMKLNEYRDPWYNIDAIYWEAALHDLGIE